MGAQPENSALDNSLNNPKHVRVWQSPLRSRESPAHGGDDDALDVFRGPSQLRVEGIACLLGFLEACHLEFGGVVTGMPGVHHDAEEARVGVAGRLWMGHQDVGCGLGVKNVAVVVHETGIEKFGCSDPWHVRRVGRKDGLKGSTVRSGPYSVTNRGGSGRRGHSLVGSTAGHCGYSK